MNEDELKRRAHDTGCKQGQANIWDAAYAEMNAKTKCPCGSNEFKYVVDRATGVYSSETWSGFYDPSKHFGAVCLKCSKPWPGSADARAITGPCSCGYMWFVYFDASARRYSAHKENLTYNPAIHPLAICGSCYKPMPGSKAVAGKYPEEIWKKSLNPLTELEPFDPNKEPLSHKMIVAALQGAFANPGWIENWTAQQLVDMVVEAVLVNRNEIPRKP
ncbi:MAG: hypothetical protein WCK90_00520 [archaeon]